MLRTRCTSATVSAFSMRPSELRVLSSLGAAAANVMPALSRIWRSRLARRRRRRVGLLCVAMWFPSVTSLTEMIASGFPEPGNPR
jgi:hypothetical protein